MTGRTLHVRPAAVAGAFYPAEPGPLHRLVEACIRRAVLPPPDSPPPRALVVPHAGLVYSGPIAASAYLRAVPVADEVERVVLLGPSHHVIFRGIAASSADAFATPLGLTAVDTDAVSASLRAAAVIVADEPHAHEHSLEVQLPFLQTLLPRAALVPFVVGDASADEVADLLALHDRPGTLVVVSTDLSHYHPYAEARELDRRTAAAIVARHPDRLDARSACGVRGLRGLLALAERDHRAVEEIDLRSSGDTAGDHERVVGYGAFAVT